MMETVRSWVSAVAAASFLLSAAKLLAPEGTVRKVVSLSGGLALLIVLLAPLVRMDFSSLAPETWENWDAAVIRRQEELEQTQSETLRTGIEERAEEYIWDSAAALGISCTVRIETEAGEDGIWIPCRAELSCPSSEPLSALLEEQLGIPRERQVFHEESGK